MSGMGDFGDLVLVIGDIHIPQRAPQLPGWVAELLATDKIKTVLCTGNVGSNEMVQRLRSIAGGGGVHIVKGDMDHSFDFPETDVVQIGDFRVGLLHGHQVCMWGDVGALGMWQRKLDVDILISGHTHKNSISEVNGKYFVNPGSATGAYTPFLMEPIVPSFMLMAIQGSNAVLYVYEEKDGKSNISMSEFKKSAQ